MEYKKCPEKNSIFQNFFNNCYEYLKEISENQT